MNVPHHEGKENRIAQIYNCLFRYAGCIEVFEEI